MQGNWIGGFSWYIVVMLMVGRARVFRSRVACRCPDGTLAARPCLLGVVGSHVCCMSVCLLRCIYFLEISGCWDASWGSAWSS